MRSGLWFFHSRSALSALLRNKMQNLWLQRQSTLHSAKYPNESHSGKIQLCHGMSRFLISPLGRRSHQPRVHHLRSRSRCYGQSLNLQLRPQPMPLVRRTIPLWMEVHLLQLQRSENMQRIEQIGWKVTQAVQGVQGKHFTLQRRYDTGIHSLQTIF